MSNDNIYERLFKLWAMVAKLVLDGRRSAHAVAKVLQAIVDEARKFELYFHPRQQEVGGWIKGFDFDRHLRETGFYERTCSLEDPEVKDWLERPEIYPEEYKDKAVFLWKSQRDFDGDRQVACLLWRDDRVIGRYGWLEDNLRSGSPVLLSSL